MNSLDKQYLDLLRDIKENGAREQTRNGVTYSVFGRTIRHDMTEGFPLLTTKKMWWHGIVTELKWFLSGSTNIKWLIERGNTIWVGDAYKYYIDNRPEDYYDDTLTEEQFVEKIKEDDDFAEKWGDMGPIYPKQWRAWGSRTVHNVNPSYDLNKKTRKRLYQLIRNENIEKIKEEFGEDSVNTKESSGIDQIENLIDTLVENPNSRRMVVSAWNVGDLDDMKLPPCHYAFVVRTRELTAEERLGLISPSTLNHIEDYENLSDEEIHELGDDQLIPTRGISLCWDQRSVDTPLGLPFNIASYGLLLKMIASEVNMVPLELIGHLKDTHIYENQLEGVEEQLQREGSSLPEVRVPDGLYSCISELELVNYDPEDKIHFPLSN